MGLSCRLRPTMAAPRLLLRILADEERSDSGQAHESSPNGSLWPCSWVPAGVLGPSPPGFPSPHHPICQRHCCPLPCPCSPPGSPRGLAGTGVGAGAGSPGEQRLTEFPPTKPQEGLSTGQRLLGLGVSPSPSWGGLQALSVQDSHPQAQVSGGRWSRPGQPWDVPGSA